MWRKFQDHSFRGLGSPEKIAPEFCFFVIPWGNHLCSLLSRHMVTFSFLAPLGLGGAGHLVLSNALWENLWANVMRVTSGLKHLIAHGKPSRRLFPSFSSQQWQWWQIHQPDSWDGGTWISHSSQMAKQMRFTREMICYLGCSYFGFVPSHDRSKTNCIVVRSGREVVKWYHIIVDVLFLK